MIEETTVRVLDDGVVSERGPANDDEVDRLSVAIGRCIPAEMTVQSYAGHNSICLLVQKDMDNRPISGTHGRFLFAEWQQQILGQPPIEERPDSPIHADDLQI